MLPRQRWRLGICTERLRAIPGGAGAAPPESTTPTRAEAHGEATVLAMRSPRKRTPQVAMTRGRRTREGELPTTIWMDPPSREEERDLLVALHAQLRIGALDVNGFPSAAHKEAFRIRGLDRPPRQSCLTPAPSTPDSVDEPSPRARSRSRNPEGRGAWRPARALAALAFTAFAAQAQVAEATRPQGAIGTGLMSGAGGPRGWGKPAGCLQADRPRAVEWPCWRLVAGKRLEGLR